LAKEKVKNVFKHPWVNMFHNIRKTEFTLETQKRLQDYSLSATISSTDLITINDDIEEEEEDSSPRKGAWVGIKEEIAKGDKTEANLQALKRLKVVKDLKIDTIRLELTSMSTSDFQTPTNVRQKGNPFDETKLYETSYIDSDDDSLFDTNHPRSDFRKLTLQGVENIIEGFSKIEERDTSRHARTSKFRKPGQFNKLLAKLEE
jgi:hypothetical protein